MVPVANVLDKFYETKPLRSERASIVKLFLDKLLEERGEATHYVKGNRRIPLLPINGQTVAIRLGHMKTSELYYVYSICKDSSSFSRMFWFMTRTKVLA